MQNKINLFSAVIFYGLIIVIAAMMSCYTHSEWGNDSTDEASGQYTTDSGATVFVDEESPNAPDSLTVEDADISEISLGSGDNTQTYDVIGSVYIDFGDSEVYDDVVVSIPNTDDYTDTDNIILGEFIEDVYGEDAVTFTNTVVLGEDGTELITNTDEDAVTFLSDIGVDSTGTYVFVGLPSDVGFVTGQVISTGTAVNQGLIVGTSGGDVVGTTDNNGYYSISASNQSNIFYSYEPQSGNYGAEYTLVNYDTTELDINLIPPVQITSGPSNGCMNEAHWMAYNQNGNLQVIENQQTIMPTEGTGMAFITSGPGAYLEKLSKFSLTFTVANNNETIELDYNFMSDEYPEWVGSVFNDLFNIVLYTQDEGAILLVNETINGTAMFPSTSGFDGEMGWQHLVIPVSDYVNGNHPVTLEFLVSDVADTIYDSAAVIDNLHYNDSTCNASENSAIQGGNPNQGPNNNNGNQGGNQGDNDGGNPNQGPGNNNGNPN
jgi:hypothetical protein